MDIPQGEGDDMYAEILPEEEDKESEGSVGGDGDGDGDDMYGDLGGDDGDADDRDEDEEKATATNEVSTVDQSTGPDSTAKQTEGAYFRIIYGSFCIASLVSNFSLLFFYSYKTVYFQFQDLANYLLIRSG